MRILIVDDERMLCDGTARRIRDMELPEPVEVVCAYSGEEALGLLKQDRYEIIFTDIRMPGMDGITLAQNAKTLDPLITVIVITAFDEFSYAQRALRVGVDDLLVKPISLADMREHVRSAIEHSRKIKKHAAERLEAEIRMRCTAGGSAAECFMQTGLGTLPGEVRLVLSEEILPTETDGFWSWRDSSGKMLLTDTSEAAQLWLDGLEVSVGVSGLGTDLKLLTIEARTALVEGKEEPERSEKDGPVARAKAYVREHISEEFDMAVLANELDMSYTYFSRLFREQTGLSFNRYVIGVRMEEVCRRLLAGEKLVSIADALGYQNAANLTRSFTREFGEPPSRWLEKRRSEKEN